MKNGPTEDKEINVFNLILNLKQEKLLVKNEKSIIQELNEVIRNKTQKVIRKAWITNKQRLILYQRDISTHNYQKVDHLLNSKFTDAKQHFSFQNAIKLGNLLHILRTQPIQLAKLLIASEHALEDSQIYSSVLESIVVGLYGCLLFPEDIKYMLTLLYELAKLQLLNCDDPRRVLKQRTCSFKQLYFLFHEVLQSAKFFLNATMEIPIIQMMSCTDYYLDMDLDKTVMRYNGDDSEIKSIFSSVEDYRKEVIIKLAEFTNIFINSLLENVYSFPKSLAWVVCQVSKIIEKSFNLKQANAVTTELIFTAYVCPFIVDPEQYGVCTSQLTDVARHNLMQVGQILQYLALSKFEPIEARFRDIFDLLDKSRLLEFVELIFFGLDNEEPLIDSSPVVVRDIMLFTEQELSNLVNLLQKLQSSDRINENFVKTLTIEEQLSLSLSSTDNSPKSHRSSNHEDNTLKLSNIFSLGTKNSLSRSISGDVKVNQNVVLVFSMDQIQSEPIGMLSEEKIVDLTAPLIETSSPKIGTPTLPDTSTRPSTASGTESRKSFPFQDEGSIGNASDQLEAASEAASNHSADSSIELENEDQNDNLSDMVSANVSGRGTPNISGRDTPSSQVCENEDRAVIEARQADAVQPQQNITRQIRSEIDDKFCKFEIKKLLEGDETISIISETWSTDVLASDNETIDAGDSRHERPSLQLIDQAIQEVPSVMDLSETQSESAWSTDVMTSDTERLTEVDNDDVVSVAQSDDTSSVARSDDRSETDENISSARRLSTPSNFYNATVSNPFFVPLTANGSIAKKYVSSNFQEFKNDNRINGKVYQMEQTVNNVEQSLVLTENEEIKTTVTSKSASITINNRLHKSPLKSPEMAGPSGLTKRSTSLVESEAEYLKQNHIKDKQNEILLSNCSLNSNSSGSSSSHSLEVKGAGNENSERWESKQWLNSSGSSLNVTLTPSESTSELSILSSNHPSKVIKTSTIAGIGKKSVTLNNGTCLKPSASTGAIPKSISFDMSADKGLDDDGNRAKRGGFFGKLRMGFRTRRGKTLRNQDDFRLDAGEDYVVNKRRPESPVKLDNDVSDDILAKYRAKPFAESPAAKENCDSSSKKSLKCNVDISGSDDQNSFNDIKNKLRLVLSNTSEIPHYIKNNPISIKNKIETMLRLELGKARRLKEWSNVARISEAIRCINLLNDSGCLKLIGSMKEDIISRSVYRRYLVTSKQELLFCDNYLDSLQDQIVQDKNQCEKYLAAICVREFLSQQETVLFEFCDEFKQLNLADEKCDVLNSFYTKLYFIMNESPFWKSVLHNRETIIKTTLERFIMNKTYKNSIYPNGDGDKDRDRVLHQHISNLSRLVTPVHKDLLIPRTYLREQPWQPAQDALRALSAQRTPRDKVKCVVRCARCIMDLLAMARNDAVSAAADDFTPVLVYVIIKVNPDDLLSTIQYVNSFYHNQLFGEELYWWTQFCAAVEYIKTMDYSN